MPDRQEQRKNWVGGIMQRRNSGIQHLNRFMCSSLPPSPSLPPSLPPPLFLPPSLSLSSSLPLSPSLPPSLPLPLFFPPSLPLSSSLPPSLHLSEKQEEQLKSNSRDLTMVSLGARDNMAMYTKSINIIPLPPSSPSFLLTPSQVKMKSMMAIGFTFTALLGMFNTM